MFWKREFWHFWRIVRLSSAAVLAILSLAIFMLSSMAGPNQIHYLEFTLICDLALVFLAGI